MDRVWKIYKIIGPCGRGYIGITRMTMKCRWDAHVRAAKHTRIPFYDSIVEHGAAAFTIDIITECYSEREAQKCERAMIALHDTYYKGGRGFNRSIGGNGNTGGTSDAARASMIAASALRHEENKTLLAVGREKYKAMGRPVSKEGRARKNKGLEIGRRIPRTPEQIEATRIRMTGMKQPPEWKAKSQAAIAKGRLAWQHKAWAFRQYAAALANRNPRHAELAGV